MLWFVCTAVPVTWVFLSYIFFSFFLFRQVMCFSSLPVLSVLLLNHNHLADVADMRTQPVAAAALPSGAAASGVAAPPSTVVSNISVDSHVSVAESNLSGDDSGGGGDCVVRAFSALEAISLTGNKIEDWSAVDRLSGLPVLRSLRFSGNPVTSGLGASEVPRLFL